MAIGLIEVRIWGEQVGAFAPLFALPAVDHFPEHGDLLFVTEGGGHSEDPFNRKTVFETLTCGLWRCLKRCQVAP